MQNIYLLNYLPSASYNSYGVFFLLKKSDTVLTITIGITEIRKVVKFLWHFAKSLSQLPQLKCL